MYNKKKFKDEIYNQGYSLIENALSADYIVKAKIELEKAIEIENKYHRNNNHKDHGMVMLCSLYDKIFCSLFDNNLITDPFEHILGKGCIVYSYTSSSMPPKGTNYSNRIHVDCPRIIPNYLTNMGATILLDDFTEENGATWFMPGSQSMINAPDENLFYKNSKRLIAEAGNVFFFNSRLWHAGGVNKTNNWRHALTVNVVRPWMKQRINIPKAMSDLDLAGITDKCKQKLGFFSQVPENYEEYYAPFEKRKFKQETE